MSDDLNEPQATAVAHVRGPLLVFAGAGSGKTRVITYRVANLVACARVPPWRILAVTFTNKAAGEMRSRLQSLCGPDVARALWVGTFHAICAKLLRAHGAAVGVQPNFVIYDTNDQKAVVSRVLKDLDLDDRRYPPRAVLSHIHKHKQEGRGPDEAASASYVDDIALRIFRAYEERLRGANAVDFEDLILLVTRLFGTPEGDRIRRRYDYVLVDEFQDTNATQYRFLRELARDHSNLCVVGDDDQSIYRWRGADVRNIRGFRRDYPGATIVKLEQNYRSTGRIVSAALAVIARSTEREPKELWTANAEGEPIRVVAARDERDEAAFVVDAIGRARAEGHGTARHRRFLPSPRAIARPRRGDARVEHSLPDRRRHEVLRASGDQGRARVSADHRQPAERRRPPARDQRAGPRHRRDDDRSARVLGHVERCDDLGGSCAHGFHRRPRRRGEEEAPGLPRPPGPARCRRPRTAPAERAPRARAHRDRLRARPSKATTTPRSDARLENLRELVGSMNDYEAEAEAAGEKASLVGFPRARDARERHRRDGGRAGASSS